MNRGNWWSRLLCGVGLVIMLTVVPATWAQSSAQGGPQNSRMSAQHSRMGGVDINTATENQLKRIHGIGDVYARRIISGRPYTSKNQLVSKGILPQSVYDKIKDQITAHRMRR